MAAKPSGIITAKNQVPINSTIGVYLRCTQPSVRNALWNPCSKWNDSEPMAITYNNTYHHWLNLCRTRACKSLTRTISTLSWVDTEGSNVAEVGVKFV